MFHAFRTHKLTFFVTTFPVLAAAPLLNQFDALKVEQYINILSSHCSIFISMNISNGWNTKSLDTFLKILMLFVTTLKTINSRTVFLKDPLKNKVFVKHQ
jgi:hypothetical protein